MDSKEKTTSRKSDKILPAVGLKNNSRVVSKESTKRTITRTWKKVQEQDENVVPHSKHSQVSKKVGENNRLLSFKTQVLKHDTKNKKSELLVKSPAFRDRTNESLDSMKIDPLLNVKVSLTRKKLPLKKLEVNLSSESKLGTKNTRNLPEGKKYEENKVRVITERVLRKRESENLASVGKDSVNDVEDKKKKKEGKVKENVKSDAVKDKKDAEKEKNNEHVEVPKKKKFFTLSIKDRIRKKKPTKKPVLNDSSFSLPVITEEVISPSKKKTLRPRQDVKNYCDESKLLLSPRSRNSRVVLEKIPNLPDKKVPIWKTIQFPEMKNKDKDVYEISDSDLSFDENNRKRKKGIKKKPVKRLKKIVKFANVNKKKATKSVHVEKDANQVPKREIVPKLKSQAEPKIQHNLKLISQLQTDPVTQVECMSDLGSQVQSNPKVVSQVHQKPKLVSVTIVDSKNKVSFPPKSPAATEPTNEFRPFRVTQNFRAMSMMQPLMADHSLLSKTMSPIAKISENVDFSTPWRIPPVGHFSRVCNLVQSTPQIKNAGLLSRNVALEKSKEKTIEENKSKSVVEVGNKSRVTNNSDAANLKTEENEIPDIPYVPSPNKDSVQHSFGDDVEDKENAAPNHQSPQKSPKKKKKKKSILGTPVFEPQPGPSGLQKQPLRELKVLRQTNLNNFLSLDDTPERTEIRTPHGIFDDVHSTPINGKYLKKASQADIENAFGFDDINDDDDDMDNNPIMCQSEKPVSIVPKGILRDRRNNDQPRQQKSQIKKPVRFSAKEILRTLHERRVKREENENAKEKQVIKQKNQRKEKVIEEPVKEAQKENQEKEKPVTNFSDTFDLFEEQGNQNDGNKENSSALPLFADLEPTHFASVSLTLLLFSFKTKSNSLWFYLIKKHSFLLFKV